MNQFTPCNVSFHYDNLNREITDDEKEELRRRLVS